MLESQSFKHGWQQLNSSINQNQPNIEQPNQKVNNNYLKCWPSPQCHLAASGAAFLKAAIKIARLDLHLKELQNGYFRPMLQDYSGVCYKTQEL